MMRGSIVFAATLGAALLAAPAVAQDQERSGPGCRNAGTTYAVGEFACIAVCHQPRRMARCDMVLNNTSWTFVSETCPNAMIVDPQAAAQASAAMSPAPVEAIYSAVPTGMPVALAAFRN